MKKLICVLVGLGLALSSLGPVIPAATAAGAPPSQAWLARYNRPQSPDDDLVAMIVDSAGNVNVTGSASVGTSCVFQMAKYDSSGTQLWAAHYCDSWPIIPVALGVDGSGNVYVGGFTTGVEVGYVIVKYDSVGTQQWVTTYDGPPGSWGVIAAAMTVDSAGNVYVTGHDYFDGGSQDYATVKFNSSGAQQWVAFYDGGAASDAEYGGDKPVAIAVDASGNVYVTGSSANAGLYLNDTDYATIKYDANGVQQWVATYDGPNVEDVPVALALDESGNVYVTGFSTGIGTGRDYTTVKYSSSGVQQWVATYDDPTNVEDVPVAFALDESGNVYVAGSSASFGYTTVKYSSSGVQQWVATYDDPASWGDVPVALALDESGNVYITGSSTSIGTGSDYTTVKYSSSGVQQWVATYDGPANKGDEARAVSLGPGDNVYVGGTSFSADRDYALISYNSAGEQQWAARFDGPTQNLRNLPSALAVDGAGNVYVTGTGVTWVTDGDFATAKYSSSGVQQWVAYYDGTSRLLDQPMALAIDPAGNVYVTGRAVFDMNTFDSATAKYDSSGVLQWVRTYDGPSTDELTELIYGGWFEGGVAVAVDGSGNVYITTPSLGNGTKWDYATIKYDANGVQQWVATYDGPAGGDDVPVALALDESGNVYVTGFSTGIGTGQDYTTVKYSSSGVQQWVKTYNGPGNLDDGPKALAVDSAGNVYVTGGTGTVPDAFDYATVKYSSSGVQQWVATYDGSGSDDAESSGKPYRANERARAIAFDESGNVYVTGRSRGPTDWDFATIKYDSAGVQQWVATYDGPANSIVENQYPSFIAEDAVSLAVDAAGSVYVAGQTCGDNGWDYATVKYNSTGVQQWVIPYDGLANGDDVPVALALDGKGGVYVTGYSEAHGSEAYGSWNSLGQDWVTIKYDDNHPPSAKDDGYSILEDNVLSVGHPGVLGNDSDSDGHPLSAVLVSPPASGTVALNADGGFTYTPADNYNGNDSFTYKANDGTADSDITTVSITVVPVNDAPTVSNNDPAQTVQRGDQIQPVDVTANDIDSPGSSLLASVTTNGNPGLPPDFGLTAVVNNDNSIPGIASWRISAGAMVAPGEYVIRVTVGDGVSDCYSEIVVTVNENATITIDPNSLSLKSKGSAISSHIHLPSGYDPSHIDVSTIRLNGTVPALSKPTTISGNINRGTAELMVKFDRALVQEILSDGDSVPIAITGTVDGVMFKGVDFVKVTE